MPVIEARYAEALLSAAGDADTADHVGQALADIASLWQGGEFSYFMQNPVVPDAVKKDTFAKAFGDNAVDAQLKNFISLLIDKKRLSLLPDVSREYAVIKNKRRNGITVTVYSSAPLDGGQLTDLRELYRSRFNADSAEVVNAIDPDLIGGIRVKVGDTFVDDTLSGHLNKILAELGV